MTATKRRLLSNPYKTRLWLSSLDGSIFCQKEIELWSYLAHWGVKGCDSYNYKLQAEIKRSRRQLQRYLRNLEYFFMLVIIPGWSQLEGGKFTKCLRDRKIYAMPWQSKKAWMAASLKKNLSPGGAIFGTLQKRTTKSSIRTPTSHIFSVESKIRQINQIQADGGLKYFPTDQSRQQKRPQQTQSQDSVPNPATPSGLIGTGGTVTTRSRGAPKFKQQLAGCNPAFSDLEKMIFIGHKNKYLQSGWSDKKAVSWANIQTEKYIKVKKTSKNPERNA